MKKSILIYLPFAVLINWTVLLQIFHVNCVSVLIIISGNFTFKKVDDIAEYFMIIKVYENKAEIQNE